jgi:hypothetical protein
MVFIVAGAYWVCYPSVPLRLRRRFGRPGKWLGDGSLRASAVPWLAYNAAGRKIRRAAVSTFGGDYNFEPAEAAACIEESLRRILRFESAVPVVRGPTPMYPDFSPRTLSAMHSRCFEFRDRLVEICGRLDVTFWGWDAPLGEEYKAQTLGDRVHRNPAGQAALAEAEGALMVRAWQIAHAPSGLRSAR